MTRLEPQFVQTHQHAILTARHRQQLIAGYMDHFLTAVQTLRQRARQQQRMPESMLVAEDEHDVEFA